MKFSELASFAAAIVAVGVSAACGTTNNYYSPDAATGSAGDSCSSTSDCSSGLHCVNDTCVMGTVTIDGGNGKVDSGGSGGSGGAHADSGVDGGIASKSEASAPLGIRGDFCRSQSDCATGLSCVPTIEGIGGVCDTVNTGLAANATGKTCTGQCSTATDCCELPIGLAASVLGAGIENCSDILNSLSESSVTPAECTTSATTGGTDPVTLGCFLYHAYCECAANTWACTKNACVYTAACSANGTTWEGCASESRTGATLVPTCTSGKCAAALPVGNCVTATDCEGEAYVPAPGAAAGTCTDATDTDCVCTAGSCYLKCATNIDCKTGYTCDTTTNLCAAVGACVTDAQCAVSTGNVLSTCNTTTGTCTKPCTTDLDCSPPGNVSATDDLGAFNGTVCSTSGTTKGTCQPIGCTTDADCDVTDGSGSSIVQLFCVTPVVVPATEVSAITSGGT